MIEKIISGGQVGADIAGLRAAKALGLATGGYLPFGWRTQRGPCPEYEQLYGCREHSSDRYPPRTYENVKSSDGTIRFAMNFRSPGEVCTLKAILKYGRPWFDVSVHPLRGNYSLLPFSKEARAWIRENQVKTLNVAGNAITGIEEAVEQYLTDLLRG